MSDDARPELKAALDRVKSAVPDAINLRDVLEHFDDYALGVGRKFREGYSYSQTYTRGPRLEVRAGPYTIDVDQAEDAADHLAAVVIVGRDYLNSLP